MKILEVVVDGFNYWTYIVLMMIGLYAMIGKNNLVKKLIGMSIFQTAIILFYVSVGVKEGSTIPILPEEGKAVQAAVVAKGEAISITPSDYANPLPHVLMLTAIVVGVGTLGVALAVTQKIHREYGTLEESEILDQIKKDDG